MIDVIRTELDGLYGESVIRDMKEIIDLYEFYEGKGQKWATAGNLDYIPSKKITNYTKKLIKEQARFLFGKTPFFTVKTENESIEADVNSYIQEVLNSNHFSSKIIKAARDCFVGKRIALKLSKDDKDNIKISFRNSLEFVYETEADDVDKLRKIIFFYQINDEKEKEEQRIWKQTYELIDDKCILNEAIYNGFGKAVEVKFTNHNTGLDFIPAYVVINDGLTGDLSGESDVAEIKDNQIAYNKILSDDIDALKFNMFPQTVATDAEERSLESMQISPGSLVDLQTDITAGDNKQASLTKLESSFSYNDRVENAVSRIKADMYDVLNIPNLSIEDLKGTVTSAKAIKALYWQLITRCEEKYQEWEPALIWMIEKMLLMSNISTENLNIAVENVYPLLEDEYEEKDSDRADVMNQTLSRRSYIKKWNEDIDAEEELKQIAIERELLENSYFSSIEADLDE